MKTLSIKNTGILKDLIEKYGNAKVADVIKKERAA